MLDFPASVTENYISAGYKPPNLWYLVEQPEQTKTVANYNRHFRRWRQEVASKSPLAERGVNWKMWKTLKIILTHHIQMYSLAPGECHFK